MRLIESTHRKIGKIFKKYRKDIDDCDVIENSKAIYQDMQSNDVYLFIHKKVCVVGHLQMINGEFGIAVLTSYKFKYKKPFENRYRELTINEFKAMKEKIGCYDGYTDL